MKSDPIYLLQVLSQQDSLGVLSVAGNVCMMSVSENGRYIKFEFVSVERDCAGGAMSKSTWFFDNIQNLIFGY